VSEYPRTTGFDSEALAAIVDLVTAERDPCSSFGDFEAALHEGICALERELLKSELESYDVTAKYIEVAGKRYRRKTPHEADYLTQAGEIRVERSLYVPSPGGGRAICPMELRTGVVGGYWSPRSAKIAWTAMAHMTPRECSFLFHEQGGMQPSTSTLDRLPKTMSERWERRRLEFEDLLQTGEPLQDFAVTLAISMDGVLAPMKGEGRTQKRSRVDKRPMGPAGYKEVGCATLSVLAADGECLETIRYARMPQEGKADVKSWALKEARSIIEADPGLDVVFVADGAPDLWTFADELSRELDIPDLHKVLDAFHALERIKKALDAYHGEGSAKASGAFSELRQRLCEEPDGVVRVLRALRYRRDKSKGNKKKIIATQISYIEKYQDQMGYAELRAQGLPIGSGIVEAACKTLVTQRLKRSGMSWGMEGGQSILTARALIQSGRWQQAWDLLAPEFIKPVRAVA
jgi:hypothetical protein